MSKLQFTQSEQPQYLEVIDNTQLQTMFESIASDEQMVEFNTLLRKGLKGTATAYASHRVTKVFMYFRDSFLKQGGNLEDLMYILYRKNN